MKTSHDYIIAIGSNRAGRGGGPDRMIRAAVDALGLPITALSNTLISRPIGPSLRRYANAVVGIQCELNPPDLLAHLKSIEKGMGRRAGQRWGARVIDLDIILWSGGCWESPGLCIPHPHFRKRGFVLHPLREIAFAWRDPVTGFSITQLKARLDRKRPLP